MAKAPVKNPNKNKNKPQNQKKNGVKNSIVKRVAQRKSMNGQQPLRRFTLDPLNSLHVARPIHRSTPYTVIREKIIIPVITPNIGNFRTVIVCPYLTTTPSVINNGGISMTNIVAASFEGAGLPSLAALHTSNLLAPNNPSRVRLHRICAEIQCLGTNAPTTVPDGQFFYGTLRTPVDPFIYPSMNAIGQFLLTRLEMRGVSNLSVQYNSRRLHTHPLDQKSYDEFVQLSLAATIPTLSTHDSLAPMVFVFPGTINDVGITITLHAEWAVMYDADPILQSTASMHPVASQSAWDAATDAVIATAGAAAVIAGNGMGQARRMGGRAALAALGYGAEYAPLAILA